MGLMGRETSSVCSKRPNFQAQSVVGVHPCQIDRRIELTDHSATLSCFNNVTAMSPEVVGLGSVGAWRQVAHALPMSNCQASGDNAALERIFEALFAELGYISRRPR